MGNTDHSYCTLTGKKPFGITAALGEELTEMFDAMLGEEGRRRQANTEKLRD